MSMSKEEAERMLGSAGRCHNCGKDTEWVYCEEDDECFIAGHSKKVGDNNGCPHRNDRHITHKVTYREEYHNPGEFKLLDFKIRRLEPDKGSRKVLRNTVLEQANGNALKADQLLNRDYGYLNNL